MELTFRRTDGGLAVTAPADGTVAPPGHYLLYLIDADGAPSTARVVRLG